MLPNLELLPSIESQLWRLAQIRIDPGAFILDNPTSPEIFVSLLAGIAMAFAFQLLLTNLGVAILSSPGTPDLDNDSSDDDDGDDEGLMSAMRGIETKVGFAALITVTLSLFAACYLAVKLSLVNNAFEGAIVGVVVWSFYFTLVVWLGSSAVGSLIGSIVSTATSGLQGIMGTATTALGANVAKNQVISTAEEVTAAVRRELTSGFDPSSIQKTLQSSLGNLQLPGVDVDKIGSQFEKLLKNSDLKDIANNDLLKNIDRQSFVDLISNRTDFSKQDINQIADRLESTWKQLSNKGGNSDVASQLTSLLKSATPEDLNTDELAGKLQQIVKGSNLSDGNGGSFVNQALQLGLSSLLGRVLQNANISDLDVEKVSGQINKLKASVLGGQSEQHDQPSADTNTKPFSVIRADLENYILFAPPWELSQTAVKQRFKDVVCDPQADPGNVRKELEQIDRNYFVDKLSLRDDIPQNSIDNLSNYLEEARTELLDINTAESESPSPDLQKQAQDLRTKVETYLRDTNKDELNPEGIQRDLKALFEDPQAGISALKDRLGQFDRDTIVQLLSQRQDLDEAQVNQVLDQVESVRTKILEAPKQVTEQAKAQYEKTTAALTEYLRKTNLEELDPEGIQRDLKTLLDDPKAGAGALRERLSQVDRETLVKLLTQQGNLTEEQVNQSVDRVQSAIGSIVKAPRRLANRAQKQAAEFGSSLESYLKNTQKEELNPDGIKRDLQLLLRQPGAGLENLGERLGQFDRGTLVSLLSQREDISEEEANRIADQVESTYKSIGDQIKKVQETFQSAVDSLFGQVRDYLNALDRPELNYEGLQADFSKVFDDPQAGFEALGERLGQFDRETLVAVLSSREDISEADANRIIDKIEETRDGVLSQAQRVQQEVKKRYKAVKRQAQKQAIETQQIAAGAAWWLFSTALTSLVASAAAGTIAVNGLGFL